MFVAAADGGVSSVVLVWVSSVSMSTLCFSLNAMCSAGLVTCALLASYLCSTGLVTCALLA